MSSNIASVICVLFILALFLLARDRNSRASSALWIPVLWLSLAASRSVSEWFWGVGSDALAGQYVEGSPLDALIFAGLMAAGLAVLLTRRQRANTFLRTNWPLLIFFIYCGVSILWSDYSFIAFKRWIKSIGDLVMVLVVLTDSDRDSAVKQFLTWPGFLLIPLSILLIRYYPHLGVSYSPWTGEKMNIGVATQKNGLGYVCLIFGLGSIWYLIEWRQRRDFAYSTRKLMAHSIILAMALWLFSLAHSATAFVSFLIGSGLLVALSLRKVVQTTKWLHLLVGSLFLIVVYATMINPASGLVEQVGRDPTLTGRTQMWSLLYQMNVNPLFGVGYESWWFGQRLEKIWETQQHVYQAHNGYIEVYLNLGWVGVALLGLVMAWGYRNAFRSLYWNLEIGKIRLALFVVAVVYNLTEHAFRELHPVWIVFLLAIIAIPKETTMELDSRAPRGVIRRITV
jgi:exopolysaccharide production protein ExoQ